MQAEEKSFPLINFSHRKTNKKKNQTSYNQCNPYNLLKQVAQVQFTFGKLTIFILILVRSAQSLKQF